ncbi:MAG: hypothetical protein ACREQM_10330 [Candidatus Dormibacteraceae bacterium]
MRQPILYAEQTWKQQRLWVIVLIVAGIAFGIYALFFQHAKVQASQGLLGYSSYIFVLYIPAAILLAAFLLVYRNRHALIADERGLTVQNVFSSIFVDWDSIRSPRVRPLIEHFETKERRRLVRPADRAIMPKGALYFKLRADDQTLAELRRKFSRRFLYEDTVAIPLPDPDAFSWEISSHIPEAATQNLGGSKRRRGKRRR